METERRIVCYMLKMSYRSLMISLLFLTMFYELSIKRKQFLTLIIIHFLPPISNYFQWAENGVRGNGSRKGRIAAVEGLGRGGSFVLPVPTFNYVGENTRSEGNF